MGKHISIFISAVFLIVSGFRLFIYLMLFTFNKFNPITYSILPELAIFVMAIISLIFIFKKYKKK